MKFKSLTAMLLAAASLAAPAVINADEAPAKQRPEQRQFRNRGDRPGMRNGMFGQMQRNPEMMTARLVMKELRAYQAEPNDANYAALEKALNEAKKKRPKTIRPSSPVAKENIFLISFAYFYRFRERSRALGCYR